MDPQNQGQQPEQSIGEKPQPNQKAQPNVNKKSMVPLVALLSLIAVLVVSGLFFLVTRTNYKGVVDPSGSLSQCVSGTRLTWWLPDNQQMQPGNYTDLIAGYNEFRGTRGPVAIETVVRKYDTVDYYSNWLNAMAKDAGPDIVALRNDDLPGYRDYVLPLATFNADRVAQYKRDFVDLVGQETVLGDKLYGVTTYVDTLQLYYNKELLDQNSVPRAATTWADIQSQARTLSKSRERGFTLSTISLGIGDTAAQGSNISNVSDIVPMLISQYGGTIYDTRSNTVGFQIPDGATRTAFGDAVNFFNRFSDNRADEYSWDEFMGNNIDEFLQNRLVYLIGYRELESTLRERRPDLDFQVTNIPQANDSSRRTFGKYFVNSITRALGTDSQTTAEIGAKRACAEEFLSYMTTVKAQQSYISQSLMPSAHRTILQDQVNISGDEKVRVFANGSLIATNYYKPNVVETEKIWGTLVAEARSKRDVNAALQTAITKYNAIVGEGPKIRTR